MTEAAQEHLTGMPTPKQDERTPGPWYHDGCGTIFIDTRAQECCGRGDGRGECCGVPNVVGDYGPIATASKADAEFIVQACNAYGSTDALREALNVAEQNFEAIRKVLVNNLVEPERSAFWLAVRARDAARTALAGVTAPEPDIIEELIIAAYKRGFHWCVENMGDPEATAYVGKAARDYADYTMNTPSTEVEKISTDTEVRG